MKSVIPSPHVQNLISTSEGQPNWFPRDVFSESTIFCWELNSAVSSIAQQKKDEFPLKRNIWKSEAISRRCYVQLTNADQQAVTKQRRLIRH